MGRHQEAQEAYRKGLRLAPTVGLYGNLVIALLQEERRDEALRLHREWGDRLGEDRRWLGVLASDADRQRDYEALDSLHAVYLDKGYLPDPDFWLWQGRADAVRGRMAEAREHFRQAIRYMEAREDLVAPVVWITDLGLIRLIVLGDSTEATEEVRAATDRLPPDQDPAGGWINVGLLHALAGDADRARWALDTLTAIKFGEWSVVRGNLRAAIALAEGEPAEALRLLRESETPCEGNPVADHRIDRRWRRILGGRAHEALGDTDGAIVSYEGYFTEPPRALSSPLDAIFLFDTLERLGRLHEARGDSAEAAGHYLRAADLWKEADPELQPRVRRLREQAAELAPTGR